MASNAKTALLCAYTLARARQYAEAEALILSLTVSKQFAELEFETLHRHELTAAQVAAEKADWQAAGAALGKVYQALCEGENQQAMAALHTIETLIMRHGVLVPQPVLPTQTQEEVCNGQ